MSYIQSLLTIALLSPILNLLLEITFSYQKICLDKFVTDLALYFLRILILIFCCSISTSFDVEMCRG